MSSLAECIIAIAENPDREALRDLRRIAAEVRWMEVYLNELVATAVATERAIQKGEIQCRTV